MKALEDLRAGKAITEVMTEYQVSRQTLDKWEKDGSTWQDENHAKRKHPVKRKICIFNLAFRLQLFVSSSVAALAIVLE